MFPRHRLAAIAAFAAAATVAAAAAATSAASSPVHDPLRPHQWGMYAVRADDALTVSRGAGVTVAVLDSGVDLDHPDLRDNLTAGVDLVDGGTPQDANGHGTHVTGIIGARAGNGVGVEGVAPAVKILPIRVLDASNSGSMSAVAAGIDRAVAAGAHVVNLSLSPGPDAPFRYSLDSPVVAAIDRAVDAGVVVVAAAGNFSLPLCAQPLTRRRMLCVGAIDEQRQLAHYSDYGNRVDMVAPGDRIMSTTLNGMYGTMSGTSQATPHVAAAAALLRARGLGAAATVDRLVATARDLGVPGVDVTYGAGLLDMRAAVGALGAVPASAGAPAKLRLERAAIVDGRLDLLARLTSRAAGRVRVTVRARGRSHALTAPISETGAVRVRARLPRAMRSVSTGIVRVGYGGTAAVWPAELKARAARGAADLRRTSSSLSDGHLHASGTISRRARGVVHLVYEHGDADGARMLHGWKARIRDGRWRFEEHVSGRAAEGGHLSIRYTGDLERRIRGEQVTKALP